MIKVYYTATKKRKLITIELEPVRGVSTKITKHVSGKVEARKICKENGYVAWNF